MSRENFYILLELSTNPPETDAGKINAAIDRKQGEWSKLRNHPNKARQAQLYLGLLAEIKAVMNDPDKRHQEAKEAKTISDKREKEQFKKLDLAIGIISSKGQITEEEVKNLAGKFNMDEAVVKKRIKVPIVTEKQKPKTAKRHDSSVENKIIDSLKIIDKKSLYEFLDLSPTSSPDTLTAGAVEKDKKLKMNSNKDAKNTASSELAGLCMTVFKNTEAKEMYDAGLAALNLKELDEAIDAAGLDGVVDAEEFEMLMIKARELRLAVDVAEEYICNYAFKKKWKVRTPTKSELTKMRQCGNCGVMNKADSRNCSGCGFPLETACPICKTVNPSTSANCSKCGFAVGNMPNAMPLLKEAREAQAVRDVKKTAELLRKALTVWPNHPEAQSMLSGIETKEKEIDQLARELNRLAGEKKYYAARNVLLKLKAQNDKHPGLAVAAKIEKGINDAEALVQKAGKALQGDDALDFFSQAIQVCRDCREAIDGMADFPPEPPRNLKATPSARTVALQWNKSTSRGSITYRVVRKTGSSPVNALDGTEIGETPQELMDDPGVEPGVLTYYCVYSKRGEVFSKSGAVAGPVMRISEIENLTVTPGDGTIALQWKAPGNVSQIKVLVKPGACPAGKQDGQVLQGVRRDGVVASGLTNGRDFGFLVLAGYRDEKGNTVFSIGTTCLSSPNAPPEPVRDLSVSRQGGQLNLRWTPPNRGTVQLFSSRRPFAHTCGETIPTSALAGTGTSVPVQQRNGCRMTVDFQGVIHLLPVSVDGDIAVAGEAVSATSIDDVSKLNGYINSGRLYLEWAWPKAAQKVLIVYNNEQFPLRTDDPSSVKKPFTYAEYLKNSGFIIRRIESGDYYFTIFVAAGDGDETIYSTGTRCMVNNSGHKELYYEIELAKGFMGKVRSAHLKLFSKDGAFKIPEAVLIKKQHNLPLRKADGIPILDIKAQHVQNAAEYIEISTRDLGKGAYARLFFKEDAQHKAFRVMSPSKDKLKLG